MVYLVKDINADDMPDRKVLSELVIMSKQGLVCMMQMITEVVRERFFLPEMVGKMDEIIIFEKKIRNIPGTRYKN